MDVAPEGVAPITMVRTLEARLYPTPSQQETLRGWMRSACRVYNCALELRKWAWQANGTSLSFYDLCAQLTDLRKEQEHKAVPLNIQRDALRKLDRSYKAFFRRVKAGDKAGFPRFKSGRRWHSFEILQAADYTEGGKIRIPKLGVVKCRNLRHDGPAKALRVVVRAGKWYAQLVVDDGLKEAVKRPVVSAVGVDVGLTHFATLSDGSTIENPRYYRKAEKKLATAQRVVSRRKKGSNRRRKAVMVVQRQHERVRCLRHNFLHHAANKLVRDHDLIAVEDLNVKGLARTRLAKSIQDAGWSAFVELLLFKAASAGATVAKVPPAYTSQDCSGCGMRVKKTLSQREHSCPSCGLVLDRDHNAALNILAAGRAAAARGGTPLGVPVKREVSN